MKQTAFIQKIMMLPSEKQDAFIKRIEENGEDYNIYRLSPEQERMAFLQLYTQYGKYAYICPYEIILDSEDKMNRTIQAIHEITACHEIMRTVYFSLKGKIYQTICPPDDFEIKTAYFDKSALYQKDPEAYEQFVHSLCEKPFQFDAELNLRLFGVKKSENAYSVYLVMHHINHDAWTIGLMLNDIKAYLNGQPLKDEKYTYIDYVNWKNTKAQVEKEQAQLEYWKENLKEIADEQGFLDISDHNVGDNGYLLSYQLSTDMDKAIQAFCAERKVSLSDYYLTVFAYVMAELLGKNKVSIGTLTLNRSNSAFFDTYGFFVNTVVLKCESHNELSFAENAEKVSAVSKKALENQDVSFETVVDAVCNERYSDDTPLIHAMYGFYGKNLLGVNPSLDSFGFKNLFLKKSVQQVLFLTVDQYDTQTKVDFIFNTFKLTKEWSNRIFERYIQVLEAVAANSSLIMRELEDCKFSKEFSDFEKSLERKTDHDVPEVGDKAISDKIAELLAETIGVENVSYDESFFKLGCNSMKSIILLEKINETYGVSMEITDIFRYATIHQLSGHVKQLIHADSDLVTEFEEF
jgi:acyl carrier protein